MIIPFLIDIIATGVTAAKAGTLTFMVGGKEEAYEKAVKVLQHMGKNVIHTGPSGTGQVRIIKHCLIFILLLEKNVKNGKPVHQ